MDSKKPLYKSIVFWMMVLFLLYSALGFFAAPYFIKKELTTIVSNDLNSSMNLTKVSFNPYTLSTTLDNIELTDTDTQLWFSAENILVNFDLIASLFGNTQLSEIKINNPHYHLLLIDNKDKPIKYPKIQSIESSQSGPLALDIGNIEINQGSLSYLDQSTNNTVELKFKSIGFKHIDFSTDDKNSQFDLSLVTQEDDNINLAGQFNFAKLSVSGDWNLQKFSTQTLFKFITDKNNQFYGFQNQSGSIDAQGNFEYDLNNQVLPNLLVTNLQLSNFTTLESKSDQPVLSIPSLLLNNAQLKLDQKQLSIKSIATENIALTASFNIDNQPIWSELNAKNQAKKALNDTEDGSWKIVIEKISGKQNQLNLKKSKDGIILDNQVLFSNTEISNLTNKIDQNTVINLSMVIDGSGTVKANSNLQLAPFKIESKIDADSINLKSVQAWIPDDIKLTIENGQLFLSQLFSFENDQYQSKGWVKLNNLNLLDEDNQTFLQVSQLELAENEIDSTTHTINLNNIKLDKAEGNLTVSVDSELNISGIISDQSDKQQIKDKIKNTKDDWVINIKQVELIDLKTSFIDRSIKPSYQSTLTKINGTVKSLSSTNTSKADVALTGVIDTYGKFDIKGKINPLSEKAYTDLDIDIKNIDLQSFSSYSTKFTGFPINRGKADFLLNYKLNKSLLKGLNELKFKQLQFGNKVQSKDAISLPLKLAVSLLTDGNGIMSINLPVSGRIDDPEFSYGGLVFKAFFKLITGIVASPFKLLGKLIPGGADLDMSGIQFQPGTATLLIGEEGKLKAMQSILQKRPALILELSSNINTIEDNKALKGILLLRKMELDKVPDFNNINSLKKIKKTYTTLLSSQQWKTLESNSQHDGILDHIQLAENAWQELLETFSQETKNQLETIGKQRSQKIMQLLIESYDIPEKNLFLKPTTESEQLTPQVKFGIAS